VPLEVRLPMTKRARNPKDGEIGYFVPARLARERNEIALTIALMCDRKLFGEVYSCLQPDYFWKMPRDSGVVCCPIVPMSDLVPSAMRPGDVDLLIIPYEGNDLILNRIVALEVKALKATFSRQGKSPNEFGYSQASALLDLGFPHAGVMHLVVSDASPKSAWRKVEAYKVLEEDRVVRLGSRLKDRLPVDLLYRAYGRLEANAPRSDLGLVAAYIDQRAELSGKKERRRSVWLPMGREAPLNSKSCDQLLHAVGKYYHANVHRFLMNPTFDP
jgi:hypothetical protein